MKWLGAIVSVILILIGLVWIGQGINLLPGSMMSGQPIYAVLGLVLVVLGVGVLFAVIRSMRTRQG